jgi:hypothetical protein
MERTMESKKYTVWLVVGVELETSDPIEGEDGEYSLSDKDMDIVKEEAKGAIQENGFYDMLSVIDED